MRVLLLHGYGVSGSGSNVYVRYLSEYLARAGLQVHLCCQERQAARLQPFSSISTYDESGQLVSCREGSRVGPHLHRPFLGPVFPVYNWDLYPEFDRVDTFPNLNESELQGYLNAHERAVRTIVRTHEVDIIHVQHVLALAEVARRIRNSCGVPYLITPHGSAIEYVAKVDPRYRSLAHSALEEADGVVVGNEEMYARLESVFDGITEIRAKSHTISVGVDVDSFVPRQPGADQPRIEFRSNKQAASKQKDEELFAKVTQTQTDVELLAAVDAHQEALDRTTPDADLGETLSHVDWDRDRVAFFYGKLVVGKGVHVLIAAMADVIERVPNARLLIAGEGSFREALTLLLYALARQDISLVKTIIRIGWRFDRKPSRALERLARLDDVELAELCRKAAVVKLDQRVRFLGYLDPEQLYRILSLIHVPVLPSIVQEAYPLSLIEALACGHVPIGTDHGGTRFFFDHVLPKMPKERRDARVDPHANRTLSSLADKLSASLLVSDQPCAQATDLARSDYSWDSVAEQMHAAYAGVLSSCSLVRRAGSVG